jgi:hypothetical protein
MREHIPSRRRRCANYLDAGIVLLLSAIPAWSHTASTRTLFGQFPDQQNAVIQVVTVNPMTNAMVGTALQGQSIFQPGAMERGKIE